MPQFHRIDWELKRFERHFKGRTMAVINPANLTAFLELSHSTLKTSNNRRVSFRLTGSWPWSSLWNINANPWCFHPNCHGGRTGLTCGNAS